MADEIDETNEERFKRLWSASQMNPCPMSDQRLINRRPGWLKVKAQPNE